MKGLIGIVFFIVSWMGYAQQFSSEVFHKGYLVTSEGDTVKGRIKYDMEANIVSMIHEGKAKTFSSHKIYYFEINDEVLKTFRQFYSIPYNVNYGYEIPILFELLYEGPVSLLTRETLVQQSQTTGSPYWGGTSFPRTIIQYSFYFLNTKGKINYYSGRKKDLFLILNKNQSDLKKYIKDNKLNTDDIKDLIRIAAFYNSI
ncbi:MAG: hypothetical protein AAGA66_04410 [Bacteroidota bacterium]